MAVYKTRLTVRSYECDFNGHVNNAVYLNYLEHARMEALLEKGFSPEKMKESGYFVVVRRIEIDYKYPLFTGDEIIIRTSPLESRNSSGTFLQQVVLAKNETLAAEARVTWVFINPKGRPIPIPREIREAFDI
ncbi:MAG: thioesterase family protein [Calditrichia bacterium]